MPSQPSKEVSTEDSGNHLSAAGAVGVGNRQESVGKRENCPIALVQSSQAVAAPKH